METDLEGRQGRGRRRGNSDKRRNRSALSIKMNRGRMEAGADGDRIVTSMYYVTH